MWRSLVLALRRPQGHDTQGEGRAARRGQVGFEAADAVVAEAQFGDQFGNVVARGRRPQRVTLVIVPCGQLVVAPDQVA